MTNQIILAGESPSTPATGGGGGGGGGGTPATGPLAISLSSTNATGASAGSTVTSNTITATISGGTAPYTSLWTITTSDGITITTPNSPATAFRKSSAIAWREYVGTAKLTVTDALGAVKVSGNVAVSLTNTTGTPP